MLAGYFLKHLKTTGSTWYQSNFWKSKGVSGKDNNSFPNEGSRS